MRAGRNPLNIELRNESLSEKANRRGADGSDRGGGSAAAAGGWAAMLPGNSPTAASTYDTVDVVGELVGIALFFDPSTFLHNAHGDSYWEHSALSLVHR